MTSETYKASLTINPTYSIQLAVFITVLHLFTVLIALFILPISFLHKFLFVIVIIFSVIYYYRLHLSKQSNNAIRQVTLSVDKQWQLLLAKDSTIHPAVLLASSMLSRYLIVLNFKTESGRYHTLILPADSMSKELARRLRARVRVLRL